MTILLFVGDIGTGKTLMLTFFTLLYYAGGANIYANYVLEKIKYKPLNKLKSLLDLEIGQNFLAIDEGWLSMDSRRSGSTGNILMSRGILQSRKRCADVGITAQFLSSIDCRVRGLASYVLKPEIHETLRGKPYSIKVEFFKQRDFERNTGRPILTQIFPMQFGSIDICEMYNTKEIVGEMGDNTREYIDEVLKDKRYLNFEGRKGELKALIQVEEMRKGNLITSAQATMAANYLRADVS